MKRTLAVLALFGLMSLSARAHVLLTTPFSVSGPTGVVTVSAPHLTCTGYSWQWGVSGQPNYMQITYAFGTATFSGGIDSAFTVAVGVPVLVNTLNMTTGQWALSLSGQNYNGSSIATGTLTGVQLTGALAAFTGPQTALRDFADYFLTLSGTGMLSTPLGTQPDLWGNGDQ